MSLPKPYYQDEAVTIYNLDCRLILPDLAVDAVITDPPRGETSLKWDQWLTGWPSTLLGITKSLWVFGSLRMFTQREKEFTGWKMAQDIIWCKQNGTNAFNDRFRRIHEIAVQFYPKNCRWSEVYKKPLHTNDATARTVRRKNRPAQWGDIGASTYTSMDGGPRLMTSVIYARNCHGKALHPTEKPAAIISPLIEYSVPRGRTVLDLFCGSGSTLAVAKKGGWKAIGIEINEEICEVAAKRCSQTVIEP